MKLISKSEARKLGLLRFFTGDPCKRGHVVCRFVSNGSCEACVTENVAACRSANREKINKNRRSMRAASLDVARDRDREWRVSNSEKLNGQKRARHQLRRAEINTLKRARYRKNIAAERSRDLAYKSANRDKINEAKRRAYAENPNAHKSRKRESYAADPSRDKANAAARRARALQAVPAWFSELDALVWREALDLVVLRGESTGVDWNADHMIPLAGKVACGLHIGVNCQVIPAKLNQWKKNKMLLTEPLDWLRYA